MTRLFVEPQPEELRLLLLQLIGFLHGADGRQQPMDAVERPLGVVRREVLLVRPLVARVP